MGSENEMKHEEGERDIMYYSIRDIIDRKNGNEALQVLAKVISSIIISYCDDHPECDSDVDEIVDSIGINIKMLVRCVRTAKGN